MGEIDSAHIADKVNPRHSQLVFKALDLKQV